MHPDYRHSYGRVMLVLSIVAWQLKMFEYLNVHKAFGPNIYIAALMVSKFFGVGRATERRPLEAQPYDTPPPPAAPRPLQIAAPQSATLPNGLRVVLAERRGVPLVSAQLLVLSGAEVDPPRQAGLAS